MSDEQEAGLPTPEVEIPVPDAADTVTAAESESTPPETPESETPAKDEPKKLTLTQEEYDRDIEKRLAKQRRSLEREYAQRAQAQPAPAIPATGELTREQFATEDEFIEAKAIQIAATREVQQQQQRVIGTFREREESTVEELEDYYQVAHSNFPVTDQMAQVIAESDAGPKILYHLGQNPKEAARIAKCPPLMQAKELGKLEVQLTSEPPVKKTTTAPAPVRPVAARANGVAFDTTDPRACETMSMAEWNEADKARLRRKAEAGRPR